MDGVWGGENCSPMKGCVMKTSLFNGPCRGEQLWCKAARKLDYVSSKLILLYLIRLVLQRQILPHWVGGKKITIQTLLLTFNLQRASAFKP